jgi:hypothetical protein
MYGSPRPSAGSFFATPPVRLFTGGFAFDVGVTQMMANYDIAPSVDRFRRKGLPARIPNTTAFLMSNLLRAVVPPL